MPTIQLNPEYFLQLGNMPFPVMMLRLFLDGAWLPMLVIMVQGFWLLWVQSRQQKYGASLENVMLAIDVPRNNEQTPKAVEHIFSNLSGAHAKFDPYEKYWLGKSPPSFSFELVSIDGYVQYYVRTQRKFRDLVESAIYAQYPEAEISEAQDYTGTVPSLHPDPEWNVFGTEFTLKKPAAYPIRTYEEFEHKGAEEMTFKDPISAILETLAQLKPGEQMWIQWLVTPTDEAWQKAGEAVVDKILGKKKEVKKGPLDAVVDLPLDMLGQVVAEATGIGAAPAADPKKKEPDQFKMMNLSPGQRKVLEAIEEKLSKIGFLCKMRVVYAGKRDVFNKARFTSFKGAMNQFTSSSMNGFTAYGKVSPKSDYFWQRWSEDYKKSAIVRNYKNRSGRGAPKFALNIVELATVYHFPMLTVKAPLVKKTEAKRAEPPSSLPTEDRYPRQMRPAKPAPKLSDEDADDDSDGIPKNLPFA